MTLCFLKYVVLFISITLLAAHSWGNNDSQFTQSDSVFTIRYKNTFTSAEKEKATRWLMQAAQAVATLYGRFPEPKIRIELSKTDSNEPVSWGQVNRGLIPTVVFNINPDYSLKQFQNDWVAVHEFSHLFLPYAGDKDIWISEGLATYYQNVLRARHGMISKKLAWQRMIEGFRRGESDTQYQHLTLEKLSPIMRNTGSYMRVYWAGTAYFLNADIKIRTLTHGKLSLGLVLEEFNRCCRRASWNWDGHQLAEKLDAIAKLAVFLPSYQQYKSSFRMPDTDSKLQLLGVNMGLNGVTFKPDAPLSSVRISIM
jgi:hypothetical protein